MTKKARFLMPHFDSGVAKFKKGEVHDLTDETRLCIARGAAEEIDVPDEPAEADAAAAEAKAKAVAEAKAKAEAEAKAEADKKAAAESKAKK